MKVCFFTQYYLPEMGAPPARISEVARALVDRGFDVNVITAVPNRPSGKIKSGYDKNFYYQSYENGIHIHRVKVFLPKYLGSFAGRLITEASFCFFSALFAFSIIRKSEIVIIQNPPLFSGLFACLLKCITKVKVINWCSDIWPDLLIELGSLKKNGVISKSMKLIQRLNFFCSDAVAVTTPNSAKELKKNYNIKNILLWRNGVDTEFFKPGNNDFDYRKKWGFPRSKFIVGYAGLHGNFQNLNTVLDACKLLIHESPNIHVVLVGDGVQKEKLNRRKLTENIENVSLFDPISREAMPDLLQAFDALIIPLAKPMPTTIPSKFYESLSAGKPLIVVSNSEISDMVANHKIGTVYNCGKEKSLANAIQRLSNLDTTSLKKMGEDSRRLSLEFDRKKIVNKIEYDINKLIL
jgi:glycosyltransferase involved in cell wall biosynthesis